MTEDEKLTKIEIRTEADGEVRVETPWVSHVGPNRYRLDNLPFYAYRLSWDDIVEAEVQESGFPLFVRVVEKSGNRTVRVIVEPPADESEENKAAIEHLITMGCSLEWAHPGYVVVNVPADTDLAAVANRLTATRLNWEYSDPTWEDLFGPR